jgi:hypothetical protein
MLVQVLVLVQELPRGTKKRKGLEVSWLDMSAAPPLPVNRWG